MDEEKKVVSLEDFTEDKIEEARKAEIRYLKGEIADLEHQKQVIDETLTHLYGQLQRRRDWGTEEEEDEEED